MSEIAIRFRVPASAGTMSLPARAGTPNLGMTWVAIFFLFIYSTLAAQLPPTPAAGTGTSATTNPPALPLPILVSPVDMFRKLLAMNATERREFLADRPPETRKAIMAKLREYASMKPDDRELRLKITELRWYLLPLLRMPATNRAEQLSVVPAEFQELLNSRLKEWDNLPTNAQAEFLTNQLALQVVTEPKDWKSNTNSISPALRDRYQRGSERWQSMTEDERTRAKAMFTQFFELRPTEKEKVLHTLSDAERDQIERTLSTYEKLKPGQRARCVNGFEKFASLTPEEQQQFLKNAARWKVMSPNERQAWRELVERLPAMPPLPPNFEPPPLPNERAARSLPPALTVVTNR